MRFAGSNIPDHKARHWGQAVRAPPHGIERVREARVLRSGAGTGSISEQLGVRRN